MNNTTHNTTMESTAKAYYREIRNTTEHATKCTDRPNSTISHLLDNLRPAMQADDKYGTYNDIEQAFAEMTSAMSKFHTLVFAACEEARQQCTREEAIDVLLEESTRVYTL